MEFPIIVLTAILTGVTGQLMKFIVKATTDRNEDVHNFWSYSGIPSTHTALVTALATVTALVEGVHSGTFAITFVIGFLIIRDALGLRNYVNKSLHDIHKLVMFLPADKQKEFTELHVRVGHTRMEVLAGMVTGLIFAFVYFYLLSSIFTAIAEKF